MRRIVAWNSDERINDLNRWDRQRDGHQTDALRLQLGTPRVKGRSHIHGTLLWCSVRENVCNNSKKVKSGVFGHRTNVNKSRNVRTVSEAT